MAFAATRRAAMRFYNPTAVTFAPWGQYEEAIKGVVGNRRVLLMTYPQAEATGLFTNLISILGDEEKSLSKMFVACPELPDLNEFRGLYRRVRNFVGDRDDIVILAVGGGSCIDLAKVLSLAKSQVPFDDLFSERISRGKRVDKLAHVPVIAVPTTAGTGSDVTPWAAMWDMRARKKYSVQGHSLWPEAAIVDPSLAATCPRDVTRACALDALSHAFEALWNVNHNPISDVLAVAAARAILIHLPTVLEAPPSADHGGEEEPRVRAARTELSHAALRAGLAFSNTETALCHALSYRLTMEQNLKHGLACSFSLPLVLRMVLGYDAGRDARLAEVFAGVDGAAGRPPWEVLGKFLHRVGVSTELRDYGIDGMDDFERRAQEGMRQRRGRNFIKAPAAAAVAAGMR